MVSPQIASLMSDKWARYIDYEFCEYSSVNVHCLYNLIDVIINLHVCDNKVNLEFSWFVSYISFPFQLDFLLPYLSQKSDNRIASLIAQLFCCLKKLRARKTSSRTESKKRGSGLDFRRSTWPLTGERAITRSDRILIQISNLPQNCIIIPHISISGGLHERRKSTPTMNYHHGSSPIQLWKSVATAKDR